MKRALSLVLAFIMVLSLVPAVYAAEGNVLIQSNGLTVTHGETQTWNYSLEELLSPAPSGGSIAWQVSGSQIIAVATPGEDLQTGATLTFKNELEADATLRFKYTLTNEDYYAEVRDLEGNAVDESFEMELAGGESFTIIVISPDPWETTDPATLTITGLSLSTGGDATATFSPAENGSYTVNGTEITGETSYTEAIGTAYSLSATADSGYRFFGWSNGSEYVSYKAEAAVTVNENCTIQPVFIKDTVAVFGVGEARFQSLTEADDYAANNVVKTIVLMNDGVLTGEHTVSAGNTLLIPYNDANSLHVEATPTATPNDSGNLWNNVAWEKPSAYRTLTMAQGAKLTIQGSLNVGGRHSAGPFMTAGAPSGKVGMIKMEEGSNITVTGSLYCWGYIYGDGTVTAKNGAMIHENIQFTDFRGGNATAGIAMSYLVFPMTQYYVQNIEVAATFEYGAIENVWGSIFLGSNNQVYGTSVQFIGVDPALAMFVPGENGTVTKTYIPETDRLQLDVTGDGSINPMTLNMDAITEMMGGPLNTETFVLPINNNMTVNVNSGTTTLNQSLGLLPGAVLTIAKDAELFVNQGDVYRDEDGNPVLYNGGHNLIVYDRQQWLEGWQILEDGSLELIDTYYVYTNQGAKRLQPVPYSVTGTYTRTEADLVDAVLDINGTLITDGYLYNTVSAVPDEEGNAELVGNTPIISSGKTGKVVMNNGAGQDMLTMQATQIGSDPVFVSLFMISARLQNADGTYLDTLGAEAGTEFTYCAHCGNWDVTTHTTVDITWIVDGVDGTQEVCVGTQPVYNEGTDPVKDGFEFIGWSTENDNVPEYTSAELPVATEDEVYYACFEKTAQGLLGDFDGDDEVTAEDLTALARHIAGIEDLTDEALANADVDGSGEVDAEDLTQHARYVAGIIKDWTQE